MSAKKGSNVPKIIIPAKKGIVRTTSTSAFADHEYAVDLEHDGNKEKRKELSSLQNTPTKVPAKKSRGDENSEISNAALLETLTAS